MRPPGGDVVAIGERWKVHLSRGLRSLELGDHDAARSAFVEAHRLAPDRAETCAALGREHLRRGQMDQAEPLLRRAYNLDRSMLAAGTALARLIGIGRGRLGEAHELVDEALAAHPAEPTLLIVKGELYLEADRIPEARTTFEEALAAGADAVTARAGIARTYNAEGITLSEGGQDEAALFWFKRATDLDAAWAGPHVNLGVVFARLGRRVRAQESYERAIALDPHNPVAYFNLGNLCRMQGDNPAAVRAYERVLEIAPEYPYVRGALGDALGETGEFDRAIELFRQELERDPLNLSCWGNLGLAYSCLGDDHRAEECLRRALDLDPAYFNGCCNLAALLARQGKSGEAAQLLRRACDVDKERAAMWFSRDERFAPWRGHPRFAFLEQPTD
jgi:tetratricopeptide (TPR) repeat protein